MSGPDDFPGVPSDDVMRAQVSRVQYWPGQGVQVAPLATVVAVLVQVKAATA